MNPLLDQFAVGAAIAGAVIFLAVRFLRKRAAGKSCGPDCSCGTAPKIGSSPRKLGRD